MKPRAKVIINPTAGANSTHRKWPGIQSLLKSLGLAFDFQFTEGKGHGIELAKEATGEGYNYLVAVGGDGTIHEVANGILETGNFKHTSLGIICTGTGSDLSRTLNLSHDYAQACSCLTNDHRRMIDIGLVQYIKNGQPLQRYFVNAAGIGFDATVTAASERVPKFLGGTLPYLTGLLGTFLTYRNRTVTFKIGGNNLETARIMSLVVANGQYFGGGMHIAPQAQLDDAKFDTIILGNFGKLEILRNLSKVYKGTHLSHPKVRLEKDVQITVESQQKLLVQADGEVLGQGPATFTLLPQALSLAV